MFYPYIIRRLWCTKRRYNRSILNIVPYYIKCCFLFLNKIGFYRQILAKTFDTEFHQNSSSVCHVVLSGHMDGPTYLMKHVVTFRSCFAKESKKNLKFKIAIFWVMTPVGKLPTFRDIFLPSLSARKMV